MFYFIPTPIGNLGDISQRALKTLTKCEVIFCEDSRVTKKLLALLSKEYELEFGDKQFYSMHSHNEQELLEKIDKEIFKKECCYLSDAGMPCISDPGIYLVNYLQKNSICYEVLSGSNAALVGAVASGMIEKEFIFLGFLPNTGSKRDAAILKLTTNNYPTIVYESPKRILSLLNEIAKIDKEREIFIIKEATKKFETKFKANAKELLEIVKELNLKGEWTVVVAPSSSAAPEHSITLKDIEELVIPPKQKAKLISKLTGENIKDIYNKLSK